MRWVSLGALVAAGVLLAALWGHVPARWITHWGAHGADGWATKSVAAVAVPLVLGLATWVLFELLAFFIARRPDGTGIPRALTAVYAQVLRTVGLAMVLAFAALALVLPLLQPRSSLPIAVGFPTVIVLVLGAAMVWAGRETRRLRASGVAFPEGYRGIFYKNARDARLWVPKAAGVGWTINFAHRLAWPVLIAIIGGVVALALLLGRVGR